MPKQKLFKTTVERFEGTGTWTYATIPFDCEQTFGMKGKINVSGTINGKSITAVLMPHGNGKHFMILTKEIRDQTNIKTGDTIEVSLMKDDSERKTILPAEFEKALKKNKAANTYFNSLPPSHQKEYINWITEAKKEETRMRRIEKTIEKLITGHRLK